LKVKGIYVRHKGKVVETPEVGRYSRQDFADITSSFDHSMVPYERYWSFMDSEYSKEQLKIMKNDGLSHTIRIMTSTHCPMGCSFCSSTNFLDDAAGKHQPVISMDVAEVVSSMKSAIDSHPTVEAFYFVDDNLLLNKRRVERLCKSINDEFKDLNLNYFCLSRVDSINPELLDLMKVTGFKLIIYGVESFSNKVLSDMNKKVKSGNPSLTAEQTILKTLDAGITPLMNIILFYPTAGIDDVKMSIEKSVELVKKGARLTVYPLVEVYPGSSMLSDNNWELESKTFMVGGKTLELPWTILPSNEDMRSIAKAAIKMRDAVVDETKIKYGCEGSLPHPVFALTLFSAFYRVLGEQTDELDSLIGSMLTHTKTNNSKLLRDFSVTKNALPPVIQNKMDSDRVSPFVPDSSLPQNHKSPELPPRKSRA
jgi:radical SAM superfamily enzyme YgiQ (UPF0313 family)